MMESKNRIGFLASYMRIVAFSLVLVLTVGFVSCSKEDIVPEKTFYLILEEVHLSKGIMGFTDFGNMFVESDSVAVFESIYKKYGYSRETVENTYRYYFIYKTKKLEKFYNSFLGELSAKEARITEERVMVLDNARPEELTKTEFRLPSEDKEDKAYFERQIMSPGKYNFSFDVSVDPSDPTFKPHLSMWMRHSGGVEQNLEPQHITTLFYIKDGNTYHFIVPVEKTERPVSMIYGYLFDTDGDPVLAGKNAVIKNI